MDPCITIHVCFATALQEKRVAEAYWRVFGIGMVRQKGSFVALPREMV